MKVPDLAREQADWWMLNMRAAQVESFILDPREHHRMDPVDIFTDAAGGDQLSLKNGAGGYCPPESWYYVP